MADGDHQERRIIGVVTFHQRKTAFGEQTFAGLILHCAA
jgi:hypothetical protein